MLLLAFWLFVCHFLADFSILSTEWMLRAKHAGKPLLPILTHASVHGVLMLVVLLFYVDWERAFPLTFFQIFTHFIIDLLKGRMNTWLPQVQDPKNPLHWSIFGIDQLLHQVVILLMVHWVFAQF